MQKTKISRGKLALRLFLCAALFNSLLLLLIWPAESKVEEKSIDLKNHVEIKIRGHLYTPFESHKQVLLTHPDVRSAHEAILSKDDGDGYVVWIHQESYRKHHRALIQLDWAISPFTQGLTSSKPIGVSYEIAY